MSKEPNNPLVSVIIPTHNRSQLLKVAIESVLKQTHQSFEILIMDDASTENLSEAILEFDDNRLKLFRNEIKSNAATMRNMGMVNAIGLYTAFLDSDDEWLPEHLSSKLDAIKKHHADGVYGSAFVFDGIETTYVNSRPLRPGEHPADYLLNGGAVPTPSWVMNTRAAREIMFDEELSHHEDYDFFVRFANKFKWISAWEPTIIVNWKKGVVRQRNHASEIQFVQRYFKNISPKVYFNYHYTQLHHYTAQSAPKAIIRYYEKESRRYIHHFSFLDYCSVSTTNTGILAFGINWFKFSFLIIWRKFRPMGPPSIDTEG